VNSVADHVRVFAFKGENVGQESWTVLKTWQIGSVSDSIGLDGFGAKACGGSQGFSISMIG
jgi:hypothetical protein